MMRDCNSKMLQRWQSKSASGEKINITEETSMLSLEIILRSIFSKDLDAIIAAEGKNPFAMLVYEAQRDLQFAVRFRAFTKLIKRVMEQRQREQREENDLLSSLMSARDKENGQPMSEKSLVDEVMTMIVAGHETTAATLNWCWYLVATHPEVAEKLYQEVDALQLDGPPTFDQLPQLSYTKQIMDEALRLYRRSGCSPGGHCKRIGWVSTMYLKVPILCCHLTMSIVIKPFGANRKNLIRCILTRNVSVSGTVTPISRFRWVPGAALASFFRRLKCRFIWA